MQGPEGAVVPEASHFAKVTDRLRKKPRHLLEGNLKSSLSVTQPEKVLGVIREEIVSCVNFEKFKIYSYPEALCGKYFCDFSLYLF